MNTVLRILLYLFGLIAAYVLFVGIISMWVGFHHIKHDGFWVPILAGAISVLAVSWLFIRFLKFSLERMKEKDLVEV